VPELIAHGKAKVSVVRHALACPVLIAQTKTRWPLAQDALPYTPGQTPFANRTEWSRWRRAVQAQQGRGAVDACIDHVRCQCGSL
jgi:hypothetical protein